MNSIVNASETPLSQTRENADSAVDKVSSLAELVNELQASDNAVFELNDAVASEIVNAKLGIASGLFESIRMKHSPTALHCLRVALGCSIWFDQLKPNFQKNDLEIAALLHDLGKIGVPDEILTKPTFLNVDEKQIVDFKRNRGLEVLRTFCASKDVIDFVHYSSTWYDGSRNKTDLAGENLPVGARMLSIVDAFDSMTCDQVYRKAMSLDRAVAELFDNAGTQFDRELIGSFAEVVASGWFDLQLKCCSQWSDADAGEASALWSIASNLSNSHPHPEQSDPVGLFKETLFGQMLDAVIFVDRQSKILFWNPAAERITGLSAASVMHRRFCPTIVDLQDETSTLEIPDSECPVQKTMGISQTSFARFSVRGRTENRQIVDVQISPVIGHSGESLGATIVFHDSSNTCSLEERVETLYSRASQDNLTKVANRAEFDRVHAEFVEQHLREKTPCSLIICDIDFFKKINDDFGHQAGDEALIVFAALLKRFHRVGDLVARYGGEEFVLLCAGCDNKTGTERAEEIRHVLQSTPIEVLGNKCLTASFGVTEVQKGDTPELMLRRADRALMMAKENGRNRVLQLGAGMVATQAEEVKKSSSIFDWFKKKTSEPEEPVKTATLVSQVPMELAIQKLRGFVTDQDAQIVEVEGNDISIKVSGAHPDFGNRANDRPIPFSVLLKFESFNEDDPRKRSTKTRVHAVLAPIRGRDRRKADLSERANLVLNSLKSYLMAAEEDENRGKSGQLLRAATESGR
ncbi:diguanylate cyclase [Pirellulaceae bacterium]|nr:diguanylate cyclase [Pirellulaceae bacterium]